jgi:lipoprotein signal peptidase
VRIRNLCLLVVSFVAIDWVANAYASAHSAIVIYNSSIRPVGALLILLLTLPLLCAFLVLLLDHVVATVGAALCVAGVLANFVGRLLFGPVPDFIPLPASIFGSGEWQCNLADIATTLGALLLFGSVLFFSVRLASSQRRAD